MSTTYIRFHLSRMFDKIIVITQSQNSDFILKVCKPVVMHERVIAKQIIIYIFHKTSITTCK